MVGIVRSISLEATLFFDKTPLNPSISRLYRNATNVRFVLKTKNLTGSIDVNNIEGHSTNTDQFIDVSRHYKSVNLRYVEQNYRITYHV